jgi:hypothetical protein
MKKSSDINRTRDLLVSTAVPHPTAPPRAPLDIVLSKIMNITQVQDEYYPTGISVCLDAMQHKLPSSEWTQHWQNETCYPIPGVFVCDVNFLLLSM